MRLLQPIDERRLDALVDDEPPKRGTALTRRADRREGDGSDDEIEVGGRRDDRGVVAAELQETAPETGCHRGCQCLSHPAAAGGTHQAKTRVRRDLLTGRAAAQ